MNASHLYYPFPSNISLKEVAYRKACNQVLHLWELLLLEGGSPNEYVQAYRVLCLLGLSTRAANILKRFVDAPIVLSLDSSASCGGGTPIVLRGNQ